MKHLSRALLCLLLAALMALACLPAMAEAQATKVTLPKKETVYVGRTLTLTPVVAPEGVESAFHWESAKEKIATVQDGVVTGVKPGKAKITVTTDNGKKAVCMVTVAPVPVERFDLQAKESAGLGVFDENNVGHLLTGHTIQLSPAIVAPVDASLDFTWKSSKPAVASIGKNGLITGKKEGETTITVTSKYGKVARSFSLQVVDNSLLIPEDQFMETVKQLIPSPIAGAGVLPVAKRVYLKKGDLMVDMYMYNADTVTMGGKSKMAVFFTGKASATGYEQYAFIGNYQVSMKKTKPGKFSVSTIKLGPVEKILGVDETKAVLLEAMAYGQPPMDGQKSAVQILTAKLVSALTK